MEKIKGKNIIRNELNIMIFIASIFVVLIHSSIEPFFYYEKNSIYYLLVYVIKKFIIFAVPCFIFISGFKLFYNNKNYSGKTYFLFLKSRIIKIFIPYLIVNILYYLKIIYIDGNMIAFDDFINSVFLKGDLDLHLYFVIVIFQFYILTPLFSVLYRYLNSIWVFLAVFVVDMFFKSDFVLTSSSFYLSNSGRLFICYLAYFTLGMYFAKNIDKVQKLANNVKKMSFIIISYLIVMFLHIFLSYMFSLGKFNYIFIEEAQFIYCTLSIITLYLISLKLDVKLSTKLSQFLKKWSASSYYIYLFHMLIMYLIDINIHKIGIYKVYQRFIAISILCIVFSYLFSRLVEGSIKRIKKGLR